MPEFRRNGGVYAQFSRSDPVMKRRPQEHDFSIERDGKAFSSCSPDVCVFHAERAHILFGIRKADERAQSKPQERKPRLVLDDVEPEFAPIQSFAPSQRP